MWRSSLRFNRNSFYTSALIVLYINLVMNFYEVIFFSPQYQDLFRRKFLGKEMAPERNSINLNNVFFPILQIFVFLTAIYFVSKKKTTMVTFTIVILFLDMISTVLSSTWSWYRYTKCEIDEIQMPTNDTILCGNYSLSLFQPNNNSSMMEFKSNLQGAFPPSVVLVLLISASLLSVAFKFGCIIILQAYKISFKANRVQRGIEIRDSCDLDQELPCYSYVIRSDAPPQYVANATGDQ